MVLKRLSNLINVQNTALVLGGCMLMLGSIPATYASFSGSVTTNTVEFQAVFTSEQAEGESLMFQSDAAEEIILLKQGAKSIDPSSGTDMVGPEGIENPEEVLADIVGPESSSDEASVEEPVISEEL